jgi:hypothetical protein
VDSAKLNDWMQVVGIFAVVVSLVFVGLQMKQDRQIALAGQYQDRAALAIEYWNGMAQSEYDIRLIGNTTMADPDWAEIFPNDMTPEEVGVAIVSARRAFVVLDNHHYQYEFGFYDEQTWQSFFGHLRQVLIRNPVARAMVRNQPELFRPSFHVVCVQIVDAIAQNE